MIKWFKGLKHKQHRTSRHLDDASPDNASSSSNSTTDNGDPSSFTPGRQSRERCVTNGVLRNSPHVSSRKRVLPSDRDGVVVSSFSQHESDSSPPANTTVDIKPDAFRRVTFKDELLLIDKRLIEATGDSGSCALRGNGVDSKSNENLFDESLLDALQDGRLSFNDFLHEPKVDDDKPTISQRQLFSGDVRVGEDVVRRDRSLTKSIDDLADSLLKELDKSADSNVTSMRSSLNISLTHINVQCSNIPRDTHSPSARWERQATAGDRPVGDAVSDRQRMNEPEASIRGSQEEINVRTSYGLALTESTGHDISSGTATTDQHHPGETFARPSERPPMRREEGTQSAKGQSFACDGGARPSTATGAYAELKGNPVTRGAARQTASKSMTEFPRSASSGPRLSNQHLHQARFGSPHPDTLGRGGGSACSFRDFTIIEDQIGSSPGSFANINTSEMLQDDNDADAAFSARHSHQAAASASSCPTKASEASAWLAHVTHVGSPSPCHSAVIVQQGSHAKRNSCLSATYEPITSRPDSATEFDPPCHRPPSHCSNGRRSNDASLDLYIPPPPPIEEDLVVMKHIDDLDAVPFLVDFADDVSGSPTLTPYSSVATGLDMAVRLDYDDEADDPIIHSLLTLLPIKDEQDLLPVLSQAVGEIVTEIISTRRKFGQLSEALEEQKSLLRQQSCTIERQNRDIELLKSQQVSSHRSADRISSSSVVHRTSHVSSRRESRQSQELRELNCTLESILFQCSTLKRGSHHESTLKLFQLIDEKHLTGAQTSDKCNIDVNGNLQGSGKSRVTGDAEDTRTLLVRRDPAVVNHLAQVVPPRSCVRHTSCEMNHPDEQFFP